MLDLTCKLLSLWLCVQCIPNQTWLDVVCISVSSWLWFILSLGMIILAFLSMLAQFLSWEQQAKESSHNCHFVLGVILLIISTLVSGHTRKWNNKDHSLGTLSGAENMVSLWVIVRCEPWLILLSFQSPGKSADLVRASSYFEFALVVH